MDCEKIYDLIIKETTGNVSAEETIAVQNHVQACKSCNNSRKEFQQVWALSANLSRPSLNQDKKTFIVKNTSKKRSVLLLTISVSAAAMILIGILFMAIPQNNFSYRGTVISKNNEKLTDTKLNFGERLEAIGKGIINFKKNHIELENGSQVTIESKKTIKIHKGKAFISIDDDADGIDVLTDLGKLHASNARFLIEVFDLNGGQVMKSTTVTGVVAVGIAIIAGAAIFTNFFNNEPHKLKEGDSVLIDGKDKKVKPVSFEEFNTLKEKVTQLESEKQRLESEKKTLATENQDLKAKLDKITTPVDKTPKTSSIFMHKVKLNEKYTKLFSMKELDADLGAKILLKMLDMMDKGEDTTNIMSSPEAVGFIMKWFTFIAGVQKELGLSSVNVAAAYIVPQQIEAIIKAKDIKLSQTEIDLISSLSEKYFQELMSASKSSTGIVLEDQLNSYNTLFKYIDDFKKINADAMKYSKMAVNMVTKMNTSTYCHGGMQTEDRYQEAVDGHVKHWTERLKLTNEQEKILYRLTGPYIKEAALIDENTLDATQKDLKTMAHQVTFSKAMLEHLYLTDEQKDLLKKNHARFCFKK